MPPITDPDAIRQALTAAGPGDRFTIIWQPIVSRPDWTVTKTAWRIVECDDTGVHAAEPGEDRAEVSNESFGWAAIVSVEQVDRLPDDIGPKGDPLGDRYGRWKRGSATEAWWTLDTSDAHHELSRDEHGWDIAGPDWGQPSGALTPQDLRDAADIAKAWEQQHG